MNSGSVLVLDSDEAARAGTVSALEILGVQAHGVSSLEQCRQALAGGSWRTIVMSLQLEEGNPLELLEIVREGRALPPIIVVSRIVRRGDLIRAIRTPVCDFLERPVSLASLACALERATSGPGVAAPPSPAQPEHVVRAVRQALAIVDGLDGAVEAGARTVASRPTLRAAWAGLAEEEHLPSPQTLEEAAPGMRPKRLAAAIIAATCLAECMRLEGAWQVLSEAAAIRVLDAARAARAAAERSDVDPEDAFLACILRGLGENLLMVQASRRFGGGDPAAELLARLESVGPRTSGAMLASWGVPASLLRTLAVPQADGTVSDSALARLVEEPEAHVASAEPGDAVHGMPDWGTALRGLHETFRGGFQLKVGEDVPIECRLITESLQLPVRLESFGAHHARVVLNTDDVPFVASIFADARAGLWLDIRVLRNGAEARVPVEVPSWERAAPITADLRFVGAVRHAERLHSVALLAVNRRQGVRVAGDQREPVVVAIQGEDGRNIGESALVDLSTGGMGLLADAELGERIRVGAKLTLTVPLPTRPAPIRLQAKIVHAGVHKVDDGVEGLHYSVFRAGMSVSPTAGGRSRMEQALTEYIMRRQRETLRRRN